jgi:hypothetical protein
VRTLRRQQGKETRLVRAATGSGANNEALKEGTRLLSAYMLRDGTTKIWVITEADRSATTILLPDEY